MELSLIIPVFSETQCIGPALRRFHEFLAARPASFEIIVVDDGSADETVALVTALASEWKELRLLRSPANRGKGHAVRLGRQAATGRIRLFSDADGSTPSDELAKLLQALAEGADVAIGSRYLAACLVTRPRPRLRLVWSRLVNRVVQPPLLPGVVNPPCGFKAFTAAAAEQIFSFCTVDGWLFDLEVLAMARAKGFSIREVPVRWANDAHSKARIWQLPREVQSVYSIRRLLRRAEKSQMDKLAGTHCQ